MRKAVHFGAGNIGRGFIGAVLVESGYQLTFADINDAIIDALKEKRAYTIELLNDSHEQIRVEGVDAYHSVKEKDLLNQQLFEADLISCAVGPAVLRHVAQSLVPMVQKRAAFQSDKFTHVIACENMIGGSESLKNHLMNSLSEDEQIYVNRYFAFPNAAVDRIVPNQKHEDILKVQVEPFYEWVIDELALKDDLHLKNVHITPRLEAYIERKLFTVNTGHAATAYAGYRKGYDNITSAILDPEIYHFVSSVLEETSVMLIHKHGFDERQQTAYRHQSLDRFANPHIHDEIERVARTPLRKLSANERFVRPLMFCYRAGLKHTYLIQAIANILFFDDDNDSESLSMRAALNSGDLKSLLMEWTGIDEESILEAIMEDYQNKN